MVFLTLVSCTSQPTEPLRIGAVLPVTGTYSVWGINEEKGIALALEEVDNVMVVVEDTASNTGNSVSAVQKLINVDDVDVLYTSLTGVSNAIAPVAFENNKLHLYKAATTKPITEFLGNSIKTGYYNYLEDCRVLSEFAVEKNYKKIAYVSANADFSVECKESMLIDNLDFEDYAFEASKEDFLTILTRIKEGTYDAIIVTGYNVDFGKFYRKMVELDIRIPVLCAGAEDCLDGLENVAPLGLVYFGAELDEEFKEKLLDRYPDMTLLEQAIAATSYDMVKFVSEAYSKCPEKNKECLRKSITGSRIVSAQGSEGFDGDVIKLKIKLFRLNDERNVEIID